MFSIERPYVMIHIETDREYYYETNRHLLKNTKVAEYDHEGDTFRVIE